MLKKLVASMAALSIFAVSVAPSRADTPQVLSMASISNCVAPVSPMGATGIQVSGTWTGAMVVQGSADATNYSSINAVIPASGAQSPTISANGLYRTSGAGLQGMRVCVSSTGSGSAQVGFSSYTSSGVVSLDTPISTTASVTFPYGGSNGQGITSASFLGAGALDANGHFSPLSEDASQYLQVNCKAGCASLAFPYAGINGQNLTSASFLGAGALDANGKFSPMQEDASQNLLTKSVSGSTTAVTQATGTNLHAVVDSGAITATVSGTPTIANTSFAATQATGSNLHTVTDSGSVTAATQGGTWTVQPGNSANTTPWLATINQGGNSASVTGANALKVDGSAATQPVSGTFFQATQPVSCASAATCPVNASQVGGPWTQNVTQFGSTNVSTGTGAGGPGIPRVTVSNDSATNQTTGTAGYTKILDSAGTNVAGVDASNNQLMNVNAWGLGSGTTLGKVTTLLPYSGSSDAQASTANSVVGIAGYNGTTWDRLLVDGSKYLEINCKTGCGGSTTFPYNATGSAQTATAASALSITATNGTTVDPLKDVNSGQLETTLYGTGGTAVAVTANGADGISNTAINGLASQGFNFAYNGSSWDRLRTAGIGNDVGSTGIAANVSYGQYVATPPLSSNGQYAALQTTARGVLLTTPGGALASILTSASATACTALETFPGTLVSLTNTGPAMTVYPQFYNDNASCSAANLVWGDGSTVTLAAGQTISLNFPMSTAISYKLSGALTSNFVVTRN